MARVALALGFACVLGCGDTIPRTQVMLVIDAEPGVRSQTRDVQVVVRGGTGAMAQWQERLDRSITVGENASWPLEFALVPLGGDASRVYEATATALSSGGAAIARVRAVSGYRAGTTLELRLVFEDACRSQVDACSDAQTCRAGACTDADVDVTTLEPYKPSQPADAGALDDAGLPDATTHEPDTGIPDASPEPDTGTPDTGTPDTGTPDTGTPDTGSPDASPEPLAWCDACSVARPFDHVKESDDLCGDNLTCVNFYNGASCQQHCECEAENKSRCTPCDTGRCLWNGRQRTNEQGVLVLLGFCVSSDFILAGAEDREMPPLDKEKLFNACEAQ